MALLLVGVRILSDGSSARIDKTGIQVKAVEEGPFSVYIIGNGTIVPRDIDYIVPKTDGELISVNVESGDIVKAGQVLFVIENEELLVEQGNREIALAEAKAALAAQAFDLETRKLQLQMAMLQAKSAFKVQEEEHKANQILMEDDNPPIPKLKFRQTEIKTQQLKEVYQLELTRLQNFEESMNSQLDQFQSRVRLAELLLQRTKEKVEDLNIRAKRSGVIQDVELKPGQRVNLGSVIGLISNLEEVYVRLKVSAVQGHRLQLGQTAVINIRGEERAGKVVRIDPNVKGTTIDVDIELNDDSNLRSNMFVSGKVIIEELEKALFVEAPSNTIENGISTFYLLSDNGSHAEQRKITTGLLSGGKVQIRQGLVAGDEIVVSDTTKFKGAERIALH